MRAMNKMSVEKGKARARTGRPPKPPTPGQRMSLGLKVTAEIKARLDKVARETGRTQSQEAELRLERSFEREDLLPQVLKLAYGDKPAELLMQVGPMLMDPSMDPSCGNGALIFAHDRWLHGTVETEGDISGDTFVFILEGDADEAVARSANKNIAYADANQAPSTITLAEYHHLARKNNFSIYSSSKAAATAADAVLKLIKSGRKNPSRKLLAEVIRKELVSQLGRVTPQEPNR